MQFIALNGERACSARQAEAKQQQQQQQLPQRDHAEVRFPGIVCQHFV